MTEQHAGVWKRGQLVEPYGDLPVGQPVFVDPMVHVLIKPSR
jgi:hypothetical protein